MKISFVVPIWNKPLDTLKKCVSSLLNQTHPDKEIVCVFDGPDPILESYVDRLVSEGRVKKVVIEHGGACKARNAGAKDATGDAISFWDADCFAEPMMAEVWGHVFGKYPSVDFVYSGYKWTEPEMPPFDTEEFDPFTIQKYNYVASMFPCRREKVVEWDESLDGMQDWDYWRRVVKGGARGFKLEGYGFSTELPTKDSISGQTDKRVERIEKVRAKHGDGKPDLIIWGGREQSVKLAKYLDADVFRNGFWKTRDYPNVILTGFDPDVFNAVVPVNEKSRRVLYWMGWDAVRLQHGPYIEVRRWLEAFKQLVSVHLCDDKATKDVLEKVGISAEVVPLPRQPGDVCMAMPEDFKVFVFCDPTFEPMVDTVIKAMPDIKFVRPIEDGQYRIEDFSVFMQFTQNTRLEEGSKNALLNGRYLISNVKEPYAGYIDLGQEPTKFMDTVINKIRQYQGVKQLNTKAQEYWMDRTSPEKFKAKVMSYFAEVAK